MGESETYPGQIEVLPDHLYQTIHVPLVERRHWAVMRQPAHHIEFLERDLVNLVDRIDAWDVNATALNDVHDVIHFVVAPHMDIGVVHPVFP